jgi:signal transduction histidine kinase
MTGERILVVEDDAALLAGVADMLELAGYVVVSAPNGFEALAALEKSAPHLILSDVSMPRMDGYQLYTLIRSRTEWVGIPFIFLTAQSEKADIRRGKEMGADDYITKPFEVEDLLVAVRAKLQRRAQLEAARDQQFADLKRNILTVLNHEFRTPLTYISTYTDLMRESGTEMSLDELKNYMHGIQAGSDRLRALVDDFLFLVALQTGEAQQTFERRRERIANLPTLLRNLLMSYTKQAVARGVRLNSDISPALPVLLADRDYLTTAVGELVDNGIKFCPKEAGGVVTLTASGDEKQVVIAVHDTGVGLRSEELSHIFDMFVQIDRAKMEQQGSGSGLAIVYGIVQLHGGTLSAKSEPGQGATFTIDLPVKT